MRGGQDDRSHAKAIADDVRRHGPIKRIALRVGNTVTVYEVPEPEKETPT